MAKREKECILEWEDTRDGAAELKAGRLSKNLRSGRAFFTWNLPLQLHIVYKDGVERKTPCLLKSKIDMDKSWILNYMPRKGRVSPLKFSEIFIKPPSKSDLEHFGLVTAEILCHLGDMMQSAGMRNRDTVSHANCDW